jgi:ribA/ribD-fused uncharacterized protein
MIKYPDIHDVDSLMSAIRAGFHPTYIFFWGHTAQETSIGKHVLSQWWPASFSVENQSYPTAEHYMMAEKARLFGDAETRGEILATTDPAQAKALGRKVRGFADERWAEERVAIAVRGNTAKFGQNTDLKEWLIATKDAILVEASPVDRAWGIGLAANDKRAGNPETWRGLNLLGFALMKVRAALQNAR